MLVTLAVPHCTVRPVPASTLIYLERVESSSAKSNMLQVRYICISLFHCFSYLNAPRMKHIWLSWAAFHPLEINESWCRDRSFSVDAVLSPLSNRSWTSLMSVSAAISLCKHWRITPFITRVWPMLLSTFLLHLHTVERLPPPLATGQRTHSVSWLIRNVITKIFIGPRWEE